MKHAMVIIGMLLIAMTVSCDKTESKDETLAGFLVGTWVYETTKNQMQMTYSADGTWRMRVYLISGDEAGKSDIKHALLGALGLPATMHDGNSDTRGKWRIDDERLFWIPEGKDEVEIESTELTATHWTMIAKGMSVGFIKRQHWDSMTDADILAHHQKQMGFDTDRYKFQNGPEPPYELLRTYCLGQIYMMLERFAESRNKFLELQKNFPTSKYADASQVCVHTCQANLDIKDCRWSEAKSNLDTASSLLMKIQDEPAKGTKLRKWTEMMMELTKAIHAEYSARRKHADTIADILALYDNGKFDKAMEILEILYNNFFELADTLEPEQLDELLVLRDKIAKVRVFPLIQTEITNARKSKDRARLMAALKTAIASPDMPPKLVKSWTAEIAKCQEEIDFDEITKLLVEGKYEELLTELEVFIKKYPDNKRAPIIKIGQENKQRLAALKAKAYDLFDRGRWAEALPILEDIKRKCLRADRTVWGKIRDCKYQLELIVFNKAVAAGGYEKAVASGEKARAIYPDGYDKDIEPKLMEMLGQRKYREYLTKGNTARKDGDIKTARAMYTIAKKYAKTPAEHKVLDALIAAAAKAIGVQ